MAKTTNLELRLDRDQAFTFTVLNEAETTAIDVSGWATSFMVKRNKEDADVAALLTKTDGVISGTFNASPAVNTQIVTVTVADTDVLSTAIAEGLAFYEFERTGAGVETALAEGTINIVLGVQR